MVDGSVEVAFFSTALGASLLAGGASCAATEIVTEIASSGIVARVRTYCAGHEVGMHEGMTKGKRK